MISSMLLSGAHMLGRVSEEEVRQLGLRHYSRQGQRSNHCRERNQCLPFRDVRSRSLEVLRERINDFE
jgi:hypothetical protein